MLLACAAATPSPAAVLYKSVAANGTVEFSDLVPEKGRSVERIRIPDTNSTGAPVSIVSAPSREEQRDTDAAIARANTQLDRAEHALAEARRGAGDTDPMRMVSTRMSRADFDRLAFYKKDVLLARAQLLEVLKEKHKVVPTLTASNEWVAVIPAARQ